MKSIIINVFGNDLLETGINLVIEFSSRVNAETFARLFDGNVYESNHGGYHVVIPRPEREPSMYPVPCQKCNVKFGCSDCGHLPLRLASVENWMKWMDNHPPKNDGMVFDEDGWPVFDNGQFL